MPMFPMRTRHRLCPACDQIRRLHVTLYPDRLALRCMSTKGNQGCGALTNLPVDDELFMATYWHGQSQDHRR